MILTVLKAEVSEENFLILTDKYESEIKQLPPEIVHTYLAQDIKNPHVWRILTVWRSKEDLDAMRKQGTPTGVLIFRAAGAEPTLSIHEIKSAS